VWPGYGGGDTLFNAQQNRLAWSSRQPEERTQKEISSRVVAVYSQEQSLGGNNYFNPDDKLGDAAIISSDGWVVMYLPKTAVNLKRARALSSDGAVFELEKVLTDARSGLVFLKISLLDEKTRARVGGQFQVVSLAENVDAGSEVFVFERDTWRSATVNARDWNIYARPHLDTAPAYALALNIGFSHGSTVINGQGRLAGFMLADNIFLPANYLARVMPTVLGTGKVVYESLGVSGWFDSEQPIVVDAQRVAGSFAISRVDKAHGLLRVGDIITTVNGQIVTPENLWYNITGHKTVRLKVWHAGKAIDVEATVVNI
jgi:S1-C subfamily serine protease